MIYPALAFANNTCKVLWKETLYTKTYAKTIEKILFTIRDKDIESCKDYVRVVMLIYVVPTMFCYACYWKIHGYEPKTNLLLCAIYMLAMLGMTTKGVFLDAKRKLINCFGVLSAVCAFGVVLAYFFIRYDLELVKVDLLQISHFYKFCKFTFSVYLLFSGLIMIFLTFNYINFYLGHAFVLTLKKMAEFCLKRSNSVEAVLIILEGVVMMLIPFLIDLAYRFYF